MSGPFSTDEANLVAAQQKIISDLVTEEGIVSTDAAEIQKLEGITPVTPPATIPTLPSQVLNLTNWHLTLPTGPAKNATEIDQPVLDTFTDNYFKVWISPTGQYGVFFSAPAGGSTTSGSDYPRCELRETNGSAEASWSNVSSTVNKMTYTGCALSLPPKKPQVVIGQIHNSSSDIIEILVDGENPTKTGIVKIGVRFMGAEQSTYLDNAYVLGNTYTITIEAYNGYIYIYYGSSTTPTFSFKEEGTGWYFKAGAYTQSNVSKGDLATAVGSAVIYTLEVTH